MPRVITLPGGRQLTLGQYVAGWRGVKAIAAVDPRTSIHGWDWHPVDAADVLREIRRGVDDRVNRRGGLAVREMNEARVARRLRVRVTVACRNCGGAMPYAPHGVRFCRAACRRDFY